ncbi:carbon-nitrogen hydrolase family protein [Pseudonocardia bannensis]|uniref:Carbon-nitrogen hydrolase family protein n=1 Tax=Pseudonocardia bannensis TaxID=630973 RepID=A0A848DKQ4_9PSEU|nr:carbon-nitrogen hydrolase family protein [Pseudonocardia bannensis]NMH93106.1 carbon-nitrogen hydrolase family protein [Pseudonocardia bannensis]
MGTTDRPDARRVAAVQMQAVLGDVDANLAQAERLVSEAARNGAEWIALPEFFTSGVAFLPAVAAAAQPLDGPAVRAMQEWAAAHDVLLSGSLLVRDDDGDVRNAVLLVDGTGIRGRHDKDLPTMWENALYVGGSDDGVVDVDGTTIGLAVCWELTRRQTVTRLAGRVDVVLGGSGWWTVPSWQPRRVFDAWDAANTARAAEAPGRFARHVGAPVVHASHSGEVSCPMPGLPLNYRGRYVPATGVWAADGTALAVAPTPEPQVVLADLPLRRATPVPPPASYWLTPPGPLPLFAWHQQRWHGRRWYAKHQRSAPAAAHSA